MAEIEVTNHAYKRGKQRLAWRKCTVQNMALKAFENGIRHTDAHGELKRWINQLYLKKDRKSVIRIYGETVFVFQQTLLITLYQIPRNLKHYLKS